MPLLPGAVDVLSSPATPTIVQNALGSSAAITYAIVAVNEAGQDSVPSTSITTGANNASTANNTISWVQVPGASQYRVLKNGNLLANVGAGATSYTDNAGSAGVSYTAATANPVAFTPGVNAPIDGGKWTYSAATNGLASAASATDIFTLTGSASKTIRVTHLEVSGVATTILDTSVRVILRTTADSGGTTGTAPTIVAHDQNAPAATATVAIYTANPTVNDGTATRYIRSQKVLFNLSAPTAGSECTRLVLDFGNRPSQAIVLRGTAQQLVVNLNGVTVSGASVDIAVEWSEE